MSRKTRQLILRVYQFGFFLLGVLGTLYPSIYILIGIILYSTIGYSIKTGKIIPLDALFVGNETWTDKGIFFFGAGALLGLLIHYFGRVI